jgi:hypothetical protein
MLPTMRLLSGLIDARITSAEQNRPTAITNHFGNPAEQQQ